MIKPAFVSPGEAVTEIGRVFGAPLVVKGGSWLPLAWPIAWLVLARWLRGRRPGVSWGRALATGALATPLALGSEWGHNLAHAAAAWLVGRPADAVRATWGMPLLVYFDLEDPLVSPRKHIIRALGGPVFNAMMLALARLWRREARPVSTARDLADTALGANLFLSLVSFLPVPGIDGGVLLKWALVERGCSPAQADESVRRVNGPVAAGLGLGAAWAFARGRRAPAALLAVLGVTSLAIFTGLLRER